LGKKKRPLLCVTWDDIPRSPRCFARRGRLSFGNGGVEYGRRPAVTGTEGAPGRPVRRAVVAAGPLWPNYSPPPPAPFDEGSNLVEGGFEGVQQLLLITPHPNPNPSPKPTRDWD